MPIIVENRALTLKINTTHRGIYSEPDLCAKYQSLQKERSLS